MSLVAARFQFCFQNINEDNSGMTSGSVIQEAVSVLGGWQNIATVFGGAVGVLDPRQIETQLDLVEKEQGRIDEMNSKRHA